MNNKPTSLAISIVILQLIQWASLIAFFVLVAYYFYGLNFETEFMMMSLILSAKILGALVGLIFAILLHFTVKGLLNQKKWARITTIIIAILMLFAFPVGTAIGFILIYGTTKGWPVETQINTTNI